MNEDDKEGRVYVILFIKTPRGPKFLKSEGVSDPNVTLSYLV